MAAVDAREYAELRAFERINGDLGPGQEDRRVAVVAWLAAQSSDLKFEDVLAFVRNRKKPPLSIEEQMAIVEAAAPRG